MFQVARCVRRCMHACGESTEACYCVYALGNWHFDESTLMLGVEYVTQFGRSPKLCRTLVYNFNSCMNDLSIIFSESLLG